MSGNKSCPWSHEREEQVPGNTLDWVYRKAALKEVIKMSSLLKT